MPPTAPILEQPPVGLLPDGRAFHRWTLRRDNSFSACVLDYGSIIPSLHVPFQAHAAPTDVSLGFSDPKRYLGRHPYFGAMIGRVAGRITGARFTLDGRDHQLAANNGPHHLHGGPLGFDK